jgi:hypothetical protein
MSTAPLWITACEGHTTDTTPLELAALGEHTAECSAAGGRMVALHCGALRLQGFVSARLVTSLAALAVLIGLAFLLL